MTRSSWLHLTALWSVAVAQPLLGPLGVSPEFFVAHRAGAVEILVLASALVILLPLLLAASVWTVGLFGPRARTVSLALALAVLTWVFAMQVAVEAGLTAWFVAIPLAVVAGVGVAVSYVRRPVVRRFFSMLAIAIIAVPAAFLAAPGIRSLVLEPFRRANILRPATTRTASTDTPVVVVVFDELPLISLLDRNREIDQGLYPNFWALARDGIWFRNATAVSDFTRWAVPAILSGRYPRHSALPILADHPNNLFTLFGSTHRLEVDETLTSLCPERLCSGGLPERSVVHRLRAIAQDLRVIFLHATLTSDLTAALPKTTETWAGFGGGLASGRLDNVESRSDEATGHSVASSQDSAAGPAGESTRAREMSRVQAVRNFIAGIERTDAQPSLYFLHTLISHHPYGMLPGNRENKTAVEPPGKGEGGWGRDQSWAIAQHYQKQLLQTGFVDGLVGELVRRLKDADLYDRSLIVITSDHGVSFVPGTSQRGFSARSAADIMRIPLIVKVPKGMRIGRRVSDVNAESIDILPTIADALGMGTPWQMDGSSLLDAARRERPTKAMQPGASGRRWSTGARGPDLGAPLRRKLDLFGDGPANVHQIPRLAPFHRLVGRPVKELRVVDGGGPVELTHAWEFDNVDPDAEAIVFDVAGRFASPRPDAVVGVAVNGVLAAVTRTWESNPRGWLATPTVDIWRRGRNVVEVFVVESDRNDFLLRRTAFVGVRPADLNLISDAARDWGVLQSNFYGLEGTDDKREFRWTRDWAELSNLFTHTPPREVLVEVAMTPGPTKVLKIQANDCTLFEGDVRANWSRTFPLGTCAPGPESLTLRFTTDAPRGQADRRRLGVAISRVVLR